MIKLLPFLNFFLLKKLSLFDGSNLELLIMSKVILVFKVGGKSSSKYLKEN